MSEFACFAAALAVTLPVSAGMNALKRKLRMAARDNKIGDTPGK